MSNSLALLREAEFIQRARSGARTGRLGSFGRARGRLGSIARACISGRESAAQGTAMTGRKREMERTRARHRRRQGAFVTVYA